MKNDKQLIDLSQSSRNPSDVTFTVDGRAGCMPAGTSILVAAKAVGIDIPYYCYHPRLSVAANCRICMVESSMAPAGKLLPACQIPIVDGIAIKTNTHRVRAQQKMLMEFLLLNHPIDCSICDQAGECKLQDYYMRYDFKPSRLEGTKVIRNKRKVLGDTVVLDQERCILCTRCVRFMNEIAQTPQLGIFGRGSHEVVDVAPEYGKLESNYSGNIVDICPVGALLNRDFRFRARAWFLSTVPSICTGCSRGCSISVDFMDQDVYRYRPRENEAINKSWLCDQGRHSYKSLILHRVEHTLFHRDGNSIETDAVEAIEHTAGRLQAGMEALAFVASPVASNEDLLVGCAFARDVLKLNTIYMSGRADGAKDYFLMQADKNPNRTGLESIAVGFGLSLQPFEALEKAINAGQIKALLSLGHEVPTTQDAWVDCTAKLEFFAMTATHASKAAQNANVLLPAAVHVEDEGTFTQADGITQRFRQAYPPRGKARPHWRWLADLAKALGSNMQVSSAYEVFSKLSPSVPQLANFEWNRLAPANQTHPGISTMAAASDGRPAGWRERGAPVV